MPEFAQSVTLLLITALLSGLLAPVVVANIQARNQRHATEHQARLARQSKIIERQECLVETLSELLWRLQLILIAPLYYGQFALSDPDERGEIRPGAYREARDKYFAEASQLLGQIRAEIGKATRLVPRNVWEELRSLYYDELLQCERRVTMLIVDHADPPARPSAEWRETQVHVLRNLASTLDTTMDHVASATHLKFEQKDPDGQHNHQERRFARLRRWLRRSGRSTRPSDPS